MTRLGDATRSTADLCRQLHRGGRGWVLLFISLGWLVVLGGRIVYPALLPQITRSFGIDYATAGLLIGLLWVSYSLLQFPGGLLADEVGERAVLTASLVGSLVGMVALAASPTFAGFVAATVVLGVGNGLFGTTRVTVLSDIFPDLDTTAISIQQATGNVGNAVLPVAAGAIAAVLGWRLGFGALAPLFAVAAVGVWLVVPRRTSASTSTSTSASGSSGPGLRFTLRRVSSVIRSRPVLLVTTFLFLLMFLYQAVTGFLTAYLVETKGLEGGTAAALYGGFFATAIVVQFGAGLVGDRYGQRWAMTGFLALSVPAFLLLTVAEGVVALAGAVALLSCMLGGFPPGHAYVIRALPTEVQGSGYGLLRTVFITLGAAGPVVVGRLADAGHFDGAFYLLGGTAVLASLVAAALPHVD